MTSGRTERLSVTADLELTVGDLRATLVGDGQRLTLHTDDAAGLLRQAMGSASTGVVRPTPLRQVVGRVAGTLADAGLAVRVEDGRGALLDVGSGCNSGMARVLVGSSHVRLGAVRVLFPAAVAFVAAAASRRVRAARERRRS